MNFHIFLTETAKRPLFVAFDHGDIKKTLLARFKSAEFVSWGEITLEDGEMLAKGEPIKNFSFVLIGQGKEGTNASLSACLRQYLELMRVKSLSYGASGSNNKIFQTVSMRAHNVPQIKTIIGDPDKLDIKVLIKKLGLPVISKIINGTQGKGIKKHDTEGELKRFLKSTGTLHIFQEYIPNEGDYRVFFIKSEHVYTLKRTKEGKDFEKNAKVATRVAAGGEEKFVELPPEAMKIAKSAGKAMNFDVTGVDLIQHSETGKWYIMEINSAPYFIGKEFDDVMAKVAEVIR